MMRRFESSFAWSIQFLREVVLDVVPELVVIPFMRAPSAMSIASIRVTDGSMKMLPPLLLIFRAMRTRVLSEPE